MIMGLLRNPSSPSPSPTPKLWLCIGQQRGTYPLIDVTNAGEVTVMGAHRTEPLMLPSGERVWKASQK